MNARSPATLLALAEDVALKFVDPAADWTWSAVVTPLLTCVCWIYRAGVVHVTAEALISKSVPNRYSPFCVVVILPLFAEVVALATGDSIDASSGVLLFTPLMSWTFIETFVVVAKLMVTLQLLPDVLTTPYPCAAVVVAVEVVFDIVRLPVMHEEVTFVGVAVLYHSDPKAMIWPTATA